MAKPHAESCKDCLNLEDRRDVDRVAICALHHGPQMSCQEFKPRNEDVNVNDSHERFCVNCANYEEIDGFAFCARDHRPGVACGGFNRREELTAEAV